MTGCVASKQSLSKTPQAEPDANASSQTEVQPEEQSVPYSAPAPSRPAVSWQPSFTVEDIQVKESKLGLPELKVGARISSREKTVSLREAIKALAQLKGFTVSWNSDAVQDVLIDVDIKPDDDFWTAIENMLRQLDYWYEFKDNTLIIGYGKTATYMIALPNVANEFTAAIGGNMLGGATSVDNLGELSMTTVKSGTETDWADEKTTRYINRFDVWKSIRQNLDVILRISEEYGEMRKEKAKGMSEGEGSVQGPGQPGVFAAGEGAKTESRGETYEGSVDYAGQFKRLATWQRKGDGEYTVDESLGIITVTTTATLQKSVKKYIDTLKKWLFCQVSIRAHILEVTLSEGSSKGIDWSKVLKAVERDSALISGNIEYGDQGNVYEVNYPAPDFRAVTREGLRLLGKVSLFPTDFKLYVNALEEQGKVHTISEPRLNLLNGSPGVLTVGESVRYISKISKDVDTSGATSTITYTAETDDILSGLAFFVMCNVLEDDEMVLYLTPVTSQLKEPIEYKVIGDANLQIGLPRVKLRQMSTMAKVRNGDLLILGGLIDEISENDSSEIPLLGKIPWVKWAFKNEIKSKERRELIVILQPRILPM
jgi:general secretion pathway protein D/MSHA biogenesis protein MshL